jgi:hypothetical protein
MFRIEKVASACPENDRSITVRVAVATCVRRRTAAFFRRLQGTTFALPQDQRMHFRVLLQYDDNLTVKPITKIVKPRQYSATTGAILQLIFPLESSLASLREVMCPIRTMTAAAYVIQLMCKTVAHKAPCGRSIARNGPVPFSRSSYNRPWLRVAAVLARDSLPGNENRQ